jgi:hypothetical protein
MADGRDMPHATFVRPDLGSYRRLDELGQRGEVGAPWLRDAEQLDVLAI